MRALVIATSFLLAAAPLRAEPDPAAPPPPRLIHVPVPDAAAGADLLVEAELARGWAGTATLHYRGAHEPAWRSARFERAEGERYVASVPAEDVAPPGLEYYIAGDERAHFASAEDPHRVYVFERSDVALRQRELDRAEGRRAQVRVAFEVVDFGTRTVTDLRTGETARVRDAYHRLDADFSYRVLQFPLRSQRFGFSRLVGTTPVTARGDGRCEDRAEDPCVHHAGFRAGGWAELRWRLSDLVGLDTRALIQATPSGFGLGARGELRLGDDRGSHLALGGEGITEVGASAFFRLGWATVPRVPMAATVELTSYPSAHRDAAVRLLYDAAYDTGLGLRLGGRVGYQARDQGIGGFTGGLQASLDF